MFLTKPVETPVTMLFTRLRVVPHMVRDRRSSRRGFTATWLSATSTSTSSVKGSLSSPSLPLATRVRPWSVTCTPWGMGTGYLPTRDIGKRSSEHAAEHLTADVGGAGFVVAHHAAGRGQDGDAEAVVELRQVLDPRINAPARLGDAGDLLDGRLALRVLQLDVEVADSRAHLVHAPGADVALALQHLQHVRAQAARRRDAARLPRALRVADARQHVPEGIGQRHAVLPPLPARLDHAGDLAGVSQLPQHVPAQLKLAVIAPRAARQLAAQPHAVPRAVARELRQLERRVEAVLHRQRAVHHDVLQRAALGRVQLGQRLAPLVLLDRRGLGHTSVSSGTWPGLGPTGFPRSVGEGELERLEQRLRFLVRL